jgi:hypothetical protein
MQQVFIGIILFLGFTTYYLVNDNKTLGANNLALEGATATQAEVNSIQDDFLLQTNQLNELTVKSQAAQREM